ncbi:MAG: LemA family protein [Candidatus Riflebacteria bacterium]|nr:LemA family protein [Candidatus Riflebacteria bacterium]
MPLRISAIIKKVYADELAPVLEGTFGSREQLETKNSESGRIIGLGVIVLYVLGAILSWLVIHELLYSYNVFNRYSVMIASRRADLEKEYRRRSNLSSNLNRLAEKYATHEKNMFEYMLTSRGLLGKASIDAKKELKAGLAGKSFTEVVGLGEQYPSLLSVQTSRGLIKGLIAAEDSIAEAKEAFNSVVELFNQARATFPDNIFGNIYGFSLVPFVGLDNQMDLSGNEIN